MRLNNQRLKDANTYRHEVVRLENLSVENDQQIKELEEKLKKISMDNEQQTKERNSKLQANNVTIDNLKTELLKKDELVETLNDNISFFLTENNRLKNQNRVEMEKDRTKNAATSPIKIKTHSASTETQPEPRTIPSEFLIECKNDVNELTKVLLEIQKWQNKVKKKQDKEKQQYIQLSQHQLDNTKPTLALIVSDSMTRKIKNRHLKRKLDSRYETASLKKFPGQTATEIEQYTETQIKLQQPDYVIVVAGTNDLSYSYQNGTFDKEELAEQVNLKCTPSIETNNF